MHVYILYFPLRGHKLFKRVNLSVIMDKNILLEAGFTIGEINVYFALLELGESTTGAISIQAHVSQSKVYNILERLAQKGLVTIIMKNNIQYFSPTNPNNIVSYIESEKNKLEAVKSSVTLSLPQIMAQFGAHELTQVQIYKGLKGLMTAHQHTYGKLKRGQEYLYLGIPAKNPQIHHVSFQNDHLKRMQAGINCRLLFNDDTAKEILKNRNTYKGCIAKLMPKGIKTPSYFLIYADTVVISVPDDKETIAIEIINQKVADSFKTYFEQYWKISKT